MGHAVQGLPVVAALCKESSRKLRAGGGGASPRPSERTGELKLLQAEAAGRSHNQAREQGHTKQRPTGRSCCHARKQRNSKLPPAGRSRGRARKQEQSKQPPAGWSRSQAGEEEVTVGLSRFPLSRLRLSRYRGHSSAVMDSAVTVTIPPSLFPLSRFPLSRSSLSRTSLSRTSLSRFRCHGCGCHSSAVTVPRSRLWLGGCFPVYYLRKVAAEEFKLFGPHQVSAPASNEPMRWAHKCDMHIPSAMCSPPVVTALREESSRKLGAGGGGASPRPSEGTRELKLPQAEAAG